MAFDELQQLAEIAVKAPSDNSLGQDRLRWIEKLKTADVTDAELQMYKTRTRAELLRSLNDNQGLATSLAEYQTRYGDWRELFQQLDQVDKVTKADIRRVANQVFVVTNRTSAEIDFVAPTAPSTPTTTTDKPAEQGTGGAQ